MKEKLSVTVDRSLVHFLDGLPGSSRSAKLERVLRGFMKVSDDLALRRALQKVAEGDDERREREAWERTMERDRWNP